MTAPTSNGVIVPQYSHALPVSSTGSSSGLDTYFVMDDMPFAAGDYKVNPPERNEDSLHHYGTHQSKTYLQGHIFRSDKSEIELQRYFITNEESSRLSGDMRSNGDKLDLTAEFGPLVKENIRQLMVDFFVLLSTSDNGFISTSKKSHNSYFGAQFIRDQSQHKEIVKKCLTKGYVSVLLYYPSEDGLQKMAQESQQGMENITPYESTNKYQGDADGEQSYYAMLELLEPILEKWMEAMRGLEDLHTELLLVHIYTAMSAGTLSSSGSESDCKEL
ncbi:hypothetical protein BGZ58_008279 [Dissophora ornata]|nr:hypothetical protein BGZ58_008279 [Dissophora ornata]